MFDCKFTSKFPLRTSLITARKCLRGEVKLLTQVIIMMIAVNKRLIPAMNHMDWDNLFISCRY